LRVDGLIVEGNLRLGLRLTFDRFNPGSTACRKDDGADRRTRRTEKLASRYRRPVPVFLVFVFVHRFLVGNLVVSTTAQRCCRFFDALSLSLVPYGVSQQPGRMDWHWSNSRRSQSVIDRSVELAHAVG
jgi:hypothetical protein